MRALLAAAAVGAIWGATIALTLDEETVLLDVGRFLAVAFAAGSLAAALLPIALVLVSPTLPGAEITAQDQSHVVR